MTEPEHRSLDELATEVRWLKWLVLALWGVVFIPKVSPAPAADEIAHHAVHLILKLAS